MFLIAGIHPKLDRLGNVAGECPVCSARDKLFLLKQSQALRLFFVPVFRFGGKYLATCGQCASVMELPKEAGRRVERDSSVTLSARELRVLKNNAGPRCPQCGRRTCREHAHCPDCGQTL